MPTSSYLISRTLTLVLAVGACAVDPPAPAPVDTTGPSVVAVSPGDQATDVATDARVVVTFSDPIDPATVDTSWVHLTVGNYEVPLSLAVENGNELHVSPLAGLGNHATYRLTVTSTADLDGNLMTPFASQFSTIAASVQASDPTADTYGTGTFQPDLTVASAINQDSVTITLQFAQPIAPSLAGAANSIGGFIDIDIDQNAVTGQTAYTDTFRVDAGSTGLGTEYVVSLFQNGDGTLPIYAVDGSGSSGASVTPTFTATSVSLSIPLAMLGNDDGNMNLAAVVGSMTEPTDIIPNDQHLTLGASARPGCTSAAKVAAGTGVEPTVFSEAPGPMWQRN